MSGDGGPPVVAIDIDGVLRLAANPDGTAPEGAFQVEIEMNRDDFPTVFHHAPAWDSEGRSRRRHWVSARGAEWINSLIERGVQVVWASTWGSSANAYFAPALGIPHLDVGVAGPVGSSSTAADWKSVKLAGRYPGRPLVWIDDQRVSSEAYELAAQRRPADRALTLTVQVDDPVLGISPANIAEVEAWLVLTATAAGRDELRRRRRNVLARQRRHARRLRDLIRDVSTEFSDDPIVIAELIREFEAAPADITADDIVARAGTWRTLGGPDLIAVLTAINARLHPQPGRRP